MKAEPVPRAEPRSFQRAAGVILQYFNHTLISYCYNVHISRYLTKGKVMNPGPEPIRTRITEIWIDENDIIRMRYLESNTDVTPEDTVANWNIALTLFRHQKNLLLIDTTNLRSTKRGSREFMSRSEVAARLAGAALIINSHFGRIVGNVFINFSRPSYPVRLFNTEQEALAWLFSLEQAGSLARNGSR